MKRYQQPATYVQVLHGENLMELRGNSGGMGQPGTGAPAKRVVPVTKPAYRTLIGA